MSGYNLVLHGQKAYLIPTDARVAPGTLEVRTQDGRTQLVDEADLARFEVSLDQALDWQQAQAMQSLRQLGAASTLLGEMLTGKAAPTLSVSETQRARAQVEASRKALRRHGVTPKEVVGNFQGAGGDALSKALRKLLDPDEG